ncbi:MAG: ATP-grasp domain-containing protein [Pirellulales bacterium]
MSVLVMYSLPPEGLEPGRLAGEFELHGAAEGIVDVLSGSRAVGVRGELAEILAVLDTHQPDVVFNLCEAPLGRPEFEPHVAALLEWRGVPFTGSGSETLALCRRKDRTKAVLAAAGVRVPGTDRFPCIVKPADQDGSAGIRPDSVCRTPTERAAAIARIQGPTVVEDFLTGPEFVVSLWGARQPDYISIGEAQFEDGLELFTYAAKWELESDDYRRALLHYHTPMETELRQLLTDAAQRSWRAVGARGYLRLDIRLDESGLPHVLDVNPNPEVTPEMGMHRAVTESGWDWDEFIRRQVEWASGPR